MGDDEEEA
jgi:hypothetical protein